MNAVTTITKRADELKPGDILPPNMAYTRRVVCSVSPSEVTCDGIAVKVYGERGALDTFSFAPEQEVEVESPALTPAQQHAEELRVLLAWMVDFAGRYAAHEIGANMQKFERINTLLAKIDPPAPPTLEEALTLLAEDHDGMPVTGFEKRVAALLDRARRAGVFK